MTAKTISLGGFTLTIRAEKASQDIEIIEEVIFGDNYRLRGMKAAGFEPETIVSVGSHIGTFEVLAHELWPTAKIVSVEPNKDSFELLSRNAPFASTHNVAIAYQDNVVLVEADGSTGGAFVTTKEDFERRSGYDPATGRVPENEERGWSYSIGDMTVTAISFEELVRREQLKRIDLLKLDCEGGEWAIMEHLPMPDLEIKYIVGEYHAHPFETFVERARAAFPHLTIYGRSEEEGGNIGPIGPFFSFPGLKPYQHRHTPFAIRLKHSVQKRWERFTARS